MTPDILNNILGADEMLQTSNFTYIFPPVLSELYKCYVPKNLCRKYSAVFFLKKGWRYLGSHWALFALPVFQK